MMKKSILLSLFFCLLLNYAWGQTKDAVSVVEKLATQKFQWMLEGKQDSLAWILDDGLRYIHSNGLVQTREDVIKDIKSGRVTYQSIDISEVAARIFDRTAVVVGKGKFVGATAGTTFSVNLLFTEVFVWKSKGWKLVSRHASKLP